MTTTGLGIPASAPPLPPTAAVVAPAEDPAMIASLTATLTTLLQALVARQQLLLGGGGGAAGGGVAGAAAGAGAVGGGPNQPFVDPGFSAGGGGHWGFTVEGSPFGNAGTSTSAATAPATVTGGGSAPATTGPAGTAAPTINPDHLLGAPVPGGVIDTVIKSASPMAMEAMSEGDWITITDGTAQMHVHTHGVYLQQPNLIQSAIQSGKLQVHLHPDGTAHLHDVAT